MSVSDMLTLYLRPTAGQPDALMHKITVVIILAAGQGKRFTASERRVHKLQALLVRTPVLEHVLTSVRGSGLLFYQVPVGPSRPGMEDSIAAGVRATYSAPGWLLLPADMALIKTRMLRWLAFAPASAV